MDPRDKHETIISKACGLREKAILFDIEIISDRTKFITWFVLISSTAIGFILTNKVDMVNNSWKGFQYQSAFLFAANIILISSTPTVTFAINFYFLNETIKLYRVQISRFLEQEYRLIWDINKLIPPTFENNKELTAKLDLIHNWSLINQLEHGEFLDEDRQIEFKTNAVKIKKYQKLTSILLIIQLFTLILGLFLVAMIAVK